MTVTTRLTHLIFRLKWVTLLLFLTLLVFLASGIPRLEFSSDNRGFLGQSSQEYADLLAIDEAYTQSNVTLLMLTPPPGRAFTPESLRILRQMNADAWQMPYVLRVDSALNHMHSFAQGEDVFVEPMLDEFADITPATAQEFEERARGSRTLGRAMLNESGSAFGIAIRIVLPDDSDDARAEVVAALDDLRDQWAKAYPDWEVRATGELLGNDLLNRIAQSDVTQLVPLAVLAAIAIFALAIGSAWAIGALILVIGTSVVGTFGFAGWIGATLTAGTAISPLAVLVLVSTSCIHILISTIRAAEADPSSDPLFQAIDRNVAPVSVSHLTTALGFLCLNFAPSPPLAAMGNIVAFGLLLGHLAVFALIPTILHARPPTRLGIAMPSAAAMRRLASWVLARSRVWVILFPALGVMAIVGVTRIGFDDNFFRYFAQKYEFRQDADAIHRDLTGLDGLQFSFAAPEGRSVFDPDFLRSVDRFALWLKDQPHVDGVSSLSKTLKDLNMSMSQDDPAAFRIAPSQQANAQLLMFYELSLPVGMDMNTVMNVARTETLLSATVRADHAEVLRQLASSAENWLTRNEPEIAARASGISLAFARNSQQNNAQMLYGFLVALGLISLTLIITLRSLRHGLVSLVPNLFPAVLAFGFWGWSIGDVNLGSTVVTTMTLGIVVDDTVHFLMHYLRHRRMGQDAPQATQETFAVVGSSITLTSVALIIGFCMMALSGFSINQHIGMLTAIVVFFALLNDLLFLPSLLVKMQET